MWDEFDIGDMACEIKMFFECRLVYSRRKTLDKNP